MLNLNIIIIGSLHHNTLGVVRSLGEAEISSENIWVLLVANERRSKNIISSSKYVKLENISFVTKHEEIIPWLLNKIDFKGQAVVICCSDGAAEAVISGEKILQSKYKIPKTVMDITSLMVKSNQGKIAKECGLNIPEGAEFETNKATAWDSFPCIIKPFKSTTLGGKSDIRVLYSREELEEVLPILKSEKIQIQQYIDKEMEFQLIGCSLDMGKIIIIPGFTDIIRQPKNTNTGYLRYSPIKKLNFELGPVEKFIRKIGYSGLFSVEFIRGKDKKDYFLEINMRNDGNAYCVKTAGVNLPYIWVYYQNYGHLPPLPTTFDEPVYFIPDFNDLKVSFREIGLVRWFKDFRRAESHSIYNKKDMEPFKVEFWRLVKRTLKL